MRLTLTLSSLWFLFASSLVAGCTPSPQAPIAPACTYETPLLAGIPGSPGNLIPSSTNPNGQSELAHLMREMLDAMKQRRDTLQTGGKPEPLGDYTKVKCAWPTDSDTRSARFDGMTNALLEAVKAYNQNANATSYNGVVGACLACHQTTCPGPMAAIRPLYWTDGQPALLELPEPQSCDHPSP